MRARSLGTVQKVDRSASRAVVRLVAASAAVLASVVALDRSDEVSIGCMFAVMNRTNDEPRLYLDL